MHLLRQCFCIDVPILLLMLSTSSRSSVRVTILNVCKEANIHLSFWKIQ